MLRRRVIHCLDVANGRVVKGTRFIDLVDEGDPPELAERYAAEGADELVFLDISAAPEGRRTLLDIVERTARRAFIPLTVGGGVRSVDDMRDAGRRIRDLGARVVVVKGGHLDTGPDVVDVVCTPDGDFEMRGPRIETVHTHGTGCTFAAAIAARLARGDAIGEAIRGARTYLDGAIRHAPGLGAGHGPLGHFWAGILK